MTCDEVSELIIDYIEGELPRRQTQEVKEHLEICEKCREENARIESVLDTLAGDMPSPSDEYFTGIYPRIMARIETDEGHPWYKRIFRMPSWQKWSLVAAPAALALALILFAIYPGFLYHGPLDPSGNRVITPTKSITYNVSIIPPPSTLEKVAELSEVEVEDLHNVLMVALEDVLIEEESWGDLNSAEVIPQDATALPSSLYNLDSDDLGSVVDKITAINENKI